MVCRLFGVLSPLSGIETYRLRLRVGIVFRCVLSPLSGIETMAERIGREVFEKVLSSLSGIEKIAD